MCEFIAGNGGVMKNESYYEMHEIAGFLRGIAMNAGTRDLSDLAMYYANVLKEIANDQATERGK